MAATSRWEVSGAQTLTLEEHPVRELRVRLVGGTVNVVGTSDPTAEVEITDVRGEPLIVEQEGGLLTVGYEDLPWQSFLKGWPKRPRKLMKREAVVSIRVPADCRLSAGTVSAAAVVSGLTTDAEVRGVTGQTTLVSLAGAVTADTVSGHVEAQSLGGPLAFTSVSGGLTVVEGRGASLRADTVSGELTLDLAPPGDLADITITSVSGDVALRLPDHINAAVAGNTVSGAVSSAFPELASHGLWGPKQLTGVLGSGGGRLTCSTVSGAITVLRRPPGVHEQGPSPAPASAFPA
ncbi:MULTISPECIES: DUF4097 family beta strand repeat-containing protein [unclassified Streptomyces]|uniref:DUF4097 family beta strand repeat-containing protein n=1 Tax=unclassified Streptomyces TaxID=2593676 RepID=UPI0019044F50|nr:MULTISPECIES: DUF4097 family beta strand repeat-containing protein [unclassified Streptomyces]MCU4749158.1 DUF4097 domain-containing protein [Streptomyces sp. G-5]QQN77297.1 DUF4097 family beta strand repeat protein [Streptomyces sp. XC 2026]